MEAQRFSIITNTGSNVSRETSTNASSSMSVGEKVGIRIVISSSQGYSYANCYLLILQRKYDALELDRESAAEEEEVVLRVNFEEFMRRLRHKVSTLFFLSLSLSLAQYFASCKSSSTCSFISSDEWNCSFSFLSLIFLNA